ncbi:MAG: hypothetical protein AB9891_05890 [Anaerolineaceae bacterium]
MKKTTGLVLSLCILTTGCTPKAAPPAAPTPDIQAIVGTMLVAELTASAPTPTNTPVPTPTATPIPPGTLGENFDVGFTYPNPEYWSDPYDTVLLPHTYSVTADQGYLHYSFAEPETYLYTFYQKEMPPDVVVETSFLNTATNSIETSVVCRMDQVSRTKWYEFRIIHFERAAVIYYFDRQDVYHNPYRRLAYAPLNVELFSEQENRLEGICKGNKLTLVLNGQEVVSAEDTALPGAGLVGIGGVSHNKIPLDIYFNYLNVRPAE